MTRVNTSVIIPTHNRAYILKSCLNSLLNQTVQDYEIIIVDDASKDETPKLVKYFISTKNKNIKYLRLDKQSGPYAARNIGIKEAEGDIIIFIDSDIIVHPRFVEDHLRSHKKNKKIYVQGMFKYTYKIGNFNFYYPNAFCMGAFATGNVSVRKVWLEEVGRFSDFGSIMGYKDMAMGIKLRELGIKPVYAFLRCKAYHIDKYPDESYFIEYFGKEIQRGNSGYSLLKKYGKLGKKYFNINRIMFISKLFKISYWAVNGIKYLPKLKDFPILPIFHILRAIMKYNYLAKGIKEAINEDIGHNSNIQ
ncbi:MAG: glycosyltransferase [bacterium]|nr:glycosyltransferase [bacterium]